jgi:acetoin utilization deacetylase AcuC-like enzyme
MMRLTAGAFYRFTRRVAALGRGPVCVLEGGYDLDALGWSAAATVCALLGFDDVCEMPEGELATLSGDPGAAEWIERTVLLRRRLDLPV